jgi:hypothetical protein
MPEFLQGEFYRKGAWNAKKTDLASHLGVPGISWVFTIAYPLVEPPTGLPMLFRITMTLCAFPGMVNALIILHLLLGSDPL